MPGTKTGGKLAAQTNKERYGKDWYAKLGAMGGKKGRTGGFWYKKYVLNDIESIREAGKQGGAISRRTKKRKKK